jgi:uncharacterized protein (DUF2336 family)
MSVDFLSVRDLTLSDFPFLASLADSANAKDRRIWLRVACDYFIAARPADPDAVERFADAVSRQVETADLPTVLEAAQKLAPCPHTPVRLLAKFGCVSPEASDYMLEHGAAYSAADLFGAIESGPRQAIAVARRPNLDARLIGALVARNETDALVALAGNPRARLEGAVLHGLMQRARKLAEDDGDRRLAEALLQRRPARPESAALFLLADPLQRVEILLATQRAQLGRPPGLPAPIDAEILSELEMAAVARHPKRFVGILAKALDCRTELAERIAEDPSGEPLAVAIAALGAPSDVLVRVLIANDLQAGDTYRRIRALARLNNALNRNAAMMVMAALRGEPPGRRRPAATAEAAAPARDPALRRAARPDAGRPQRKAAV